MKGVFETNIYCSFIHRMVENYCILGKIQPWPYSTPRLNFTTRTMIFHHSLICILRSHLSLALTSTMFGCAQYPNKVHVHRSLSAIWFTFIHYSYSKQICLFLVYADFHSYHIELFRFFRHAHPKFELKMWLFLDLTH